MRVSVTYVHHNCFVLRLGGRTLVFDWPAPAHRTPAAEAVVRAALAGADAWVFFSHSHADHCHPDILDLARAAAKARFVLSFDVPDMIPELDLPGAFLAEPDQSLDADGLAVSCLEANDLGVAFLIEAGGVRVYFSGDLALWDWPEAEPAAREFTRRYFCASLERVAAFAPHLALANADPRLASFSGAGLVAETVRPRLLAPMHAFGNTARVAEFAASCHAPGVEVFVYRQAGDTLAITL